LQNTFRKTGIYLKKLSNTSPGLLLSKNFTVSEDLTALKYCRIPEDLPDPEGTLPLKSRVAFPAWRERACHQENGDLP